MKHLSLVFGLILGCMQSALYADKTIEFNLSTKDQAYQHTPVTIPLDLDEKNAKQSVFIQDENGKQVAIGQVTKPSLLSSAKESHELHFVLPKANANQTLSLKAVFSESSKAPEPQFHWKNTEGKYAELLFGDSPRLRYMYEALDENRREETYKVFHHVYDPSGSRIVTKGAGGKYTHHRGLYYGFNRVSYDEGRKKADTWHCKAPAHLAHAGFESEEAGPVLGRHCVTVDWHGPGGVFAKEQREMTVYNTSGGQLIEFASRLKTVAGPIHLDGDPQHAGFHFRADNEVAAKTSKQTYYLRPDGKDQPGKTRNWPSNKQHVNLPWNAQSFVLGDQRYSVAYLDRPENPKEARFSERDYGRFGSYFVYDLTEKNPLDLNYRVWLQTGELTGEEVTQLSASFVEPPQVTLKK